MDPRDIERFLGLSKGAFDHIPIYARKPALEAIAKVREMEEAQLFRPGLYYVVLADLCGSTRSSKILGAAENTKRVQWFVTACVEALAGFDVRNYFQFVKEVGDATLFIFSSFEDVLDWSQVAEERFDAFSQEYRWPGDEGEQEAIAEVFRLEAKKVVHLGEVSYVDDSNPIALAVNQVFKIEKMFDPGELGCTDVVRRSAAPVVRSRGLDFAHKSRVQLPGDDDETSVFVVSDAS